jgi:hypothetical protein
LRISLEDGQECKIFGDIHRLYNCRLGRQAWTESIAAARWVEWLADQPDEEVAVAWLCLTEFQKALLHDVINESYDNGLRAYDSLWAGVLRAVVLTADERTWAPLHQADTSPWPRATFPVGIDRPARFWLQVDLDDPGEIV